ncbi:DUF1667 domain-containing protein [Eubacteriales bacterium KG127]
MNKHLKPIKGTEKYFSCDTILLSVGLILENELTSNCDNEMDEVLHSKRIVIPSIVYKGNPELGTFVMPPVKTSESIPKELIPNVLEEIKKCKINGPHDIGDVIISNVCGTGADIIATKKTT